MAPGVGKELCLINEMRMTQWEPVPDLVVGNDQAMNLMDVDKGALQVLGSKKVGSQNDCPECWRSGLGTSIFLITWLT